MKPFRLIDNNGIWIEERLLEQHPVLMETVTEIITHEDGTTEEITTEQPAMDAEGNQVLDPHYVSDPIPNNIYSSIGICPQWNGKQWIENAQRPEQTTPQLSTDEKLAQMAEQLVITQTNLSAAQEALDFLLMGGM
ncbi:hypothetical protein [Jeotgalibaca porci]|uniref:hypothetical protein n=1 Tax=Jeotgalibaca porci TaxID=1868793 RepID=UPI0035A03379